MDYYGNNDFLDYLSLKHYGVKGMKWHHHKYADSEYLDTLRSNSQSNNYFGRGDVRRGGKVANTQKPSRYPAMHKKYDVKRNVYTDKYQARDLRNRVRKAKTSAKDFVDTRITGKKYLDNYREHNSQAQSRSELYKHWKSTHNDSWGNERDWPVKKRGYYDYNANYPTTIRNLNNTSTAKGNRMLNSLKADRNHKRRMAKIDWNNYRTKSLRGIAGKKISDGKSTVYRLFKKVTKKLKR